MAEKKARRNYAGFACSIFAWQNINKFKYTISVINVGKSSGGLGYKMRKFYFHTRKEEEKPQAVVPSFVMSQADFKYTMGVNAFDYFFYSLSLNLSGSAEK